MCTMGSSGSTATSAGTCRSARQYIGEDETVAFGTLADNHVKRASEPRPIGDKGMKFPVLAALVDAFRQLPQ
jgi:hypothetical protein